jgi:hypothetical protein
MSGLKPDDGPFSTREEARIRFADLGHAAETGVSGPPGEQIFHRPGQLERETIIDTLDVVAVELGDYDREVIARLAAALGPLDSFVVDSLFKRAARDGYDQAVYVVVSGQ